MPRPGTNPVDPKSLTRMQPAGSGLDQGPGSLAHALKAGISAWPSEQPMTAGHLSKIMVIPEVQKALEGKPANAQNLLEAIASQPPAFWNKWVADNVGGAEKVTRQTAKPQGKQGGDSAPKGGKAAAAAGGTSPSGPDALRKRLIELDMREEDVAKIADEDLQWNVDTIEAAMEKARTSGTKDSQVAAKRQAGRDERSAKRQRVAEKKAAAEEKKAAAPAPKAPRRGSAGTDKDVVSSGESRSNVADTPASAVDLDGMTVEQLSEALAKARVRDAMGATQNVGVRLGQPGSTFTDMSSGAPAIDPLAGAAQAGDGSIIVGNVGGGIPSVQQVAPSGSPRSLQPPPPGLFSSQQSPPTPPAEPFFKGFDALRGNPFGTYQKMDGTGKPMMDAQGNPVMADRWARSMARNTPAAVVKYGVPTAAVAFGTKPLIQFFASVMRGQQPAASDGIAEAVEARIRMQQRFGDPGQSRPTYVPDTPPAQ